MIIHIVEDDSSVADALAVALEDENTHPVTYPDGETFLSGAKVSASDWVIVDLGLPGMSGAEVVRELERSGHPPQIIAISGKSRTNISETVRLVPHVKVLRKPLSIHMLTEILT